MIGCFEAEKAQMAEELKKATEALERSTTALQKALDGSRGTHSSCSYFPTGFSCFNPSTSLLVDL